MRFLPIKGSAIKNEKTKEVVRKRLAYHIWLKSHEISIDTNMVNIHDSIAAKMKAEVDFSLISTGHGIMTRVKNVGLYPSNRTVLKTQNMP
jgi:hypothetical protein